MYKSRYGQIAISDNPLGFRGVKLDPENRWVKIAEMIPWDLIEEKNSKQFEGSKGGNPAKPARMALGSHIIKEKYCISDVEVLEHIKESPYLQWFIGMEEFSHEAPFDSSTMTLFRKRLTPEMIAEVNDYIIGRKPKIASGEGDDDHGSLGNSGDGKNGKVGGEEKSKTEELENKGTLILDATCAPADIKFPTDVDLLSEAREKTEDLITDLHSQNKTGEKKPRTYRKVARKDYLRFARNRKPARKVIRKAIRKQLNYLRRNLATIQKMLKQGSELTLKQVKLLETIQMLYQQQEEMYRERKHQVKNRIVSISQPWVRPIVRGKAKAPVEFGAKVAIGVVNGFVTVEHLAWDAYNESTTLVDSIEKYRRDTGHYPKRILADKIYRTRENLKYCKEHGIRMNGPKLGRPPKCLKVYAAQCRLEKEESGERNEVEGKFGVGKRIYRLDRIPTKLKDTSETTIHLVFLVMNIERRLRVFLLPFFKCGKNIIFFNSKEEKGLLIAV